MDKHAVAGYIRQAFADVEYPGDGIINLSSNVQPEEEAILRKVFADKSWAEITYADIEECSDDFVFLSREGFLYYLPAYLLAYLDWNTDDALGDSVINSLGRPHPERWNYGLYYDNMTREQCLAVKMFLEYILLTFADSIYDEEEMIDDINFWNELALTKRTRSNP